MTDFARRALARTRLTPFWLDAPDAPAPRAPLVGAAETDLLIVGGGFTGLWAALQAREADPHRSITLIEGDRLASGASGRPGAIVSTSVMHGLANAARIFPDELDDLERLGQENLAALRATLARHAIACDDEWGGELTLAVSPEAVPALATEHALHARHGHDVVLLDRDAARAEIDSPLIQGALWNRGASGTLDPARLAWGLGRAAAALGVRIHEQTPLLRLRRRGGALEVTTPAGRVRARKVLLATNAFAAGHRRIRSRVTTLRDRILVTEPLTPAQLARIGWRHRQGAYDSRVQMNYMRLTADDRILFGGKLGYSFGDAPDPDADRRIDTYASLAAAFARTFPQLDDLAFSHGWGGPIAMTTRMAVHFQHYHGGDAIWAGGYSGFGVSASRFGARIGLAILDGVDLPETRMRFATSMPGRIPPEPLRWLGARVTMHALDTAESRGGWRRPWLSMIERLGFPLS
ncbi:MAG TPA: FAD-dependent oxidoreductase [Pseudomonadales bacterium]|nr:FAD-dependent oxidoreductase [Pseudomonadales bacterium]